MTEQEKLDQQFHGGLIAGEQAFALLLSACDGDLAKARTVFEQWSESLEVPPQNEHAVEGLVDGISETLMGTEGLLSVKGARQ